MSFKTLFFCLVGILCARPLTAQTSASPNMKNPVSYGNVQWSAQEAHFSFADLGEREIVSVREMTFYAPQKVELNFRVKVRPDGSVAYVAPPRTKASLNEYCRGGASTLYGYLFTPVPEAEGDQWLNVLMTVGE